MEDRPIERLLPRLQNVKQHGQEWEALCPVHGDRKASLHATEGEGRRVLLNCKAGCEVEDIVAALGITMRDLFPQKEPMAQIAATYDYRDTEGRLRHQTVRFDPKDFKQRRPNGAGWTWDLKGVECILYRLAELRAAVAAGQRVYLVEGEKDADNVATLGLCATTNAMGAKKWREKYSEELRGADVAILPDNDPSGREHVEEVARSVQRAAKSVRVVELPGLPEKGDVSDWIHWGGKRELLEALADASPPWEPKPQEEKKGSYQRNFEIEKIQKIDSRPPVYYVHTMGGIVMMNTQELGNYGPFCLKVMETLNRVPDLRNPTLNWRPYLDECMVNRLEVVSAPEDASEEAVLWYSVCRYLLKQSSEDESTLAELRGAYSNERFLYFHGPTLHRHLSGRGMRVEPATLWDVLRKHGAESRLKKVHDTTGVEKVIRAWLLEKEAVTVDETDEPNCSPVTDGNTPEGPDVTVSAVRNEGVPVTR